MDFISEFWNCHIEKQTVIDTIEFKKFKHIKYDKILIFCGAGMSAESGIPTFTSEDSLSHKSQHELIELFDSHKPHEGYYKLLDFCKDKDYYVLTSNIDGYFARAGFDENKIIEVYGNVYNCQCPYNCTKENIIYPYASQLYCKHCNELLVSNVMEPGFTHYIDAHKDREQVMVDELKNSDKKWLIIEIGCGLNIPVIRDYSEILVEDKGYQLIRINPVDYQIPKDILSKTTIRIQYNAIQGINILTSYLDK
jgi:NAD-dependent SIR2 family protein deacetylase